jgi:hypothetical protein
MTMSKLLIVTFMALAAVVAEAQNRRSTTRRGAVGADGGVAVAKGKDARVMISRKAQLGSVCLQSAPSANGSTNLKISRKPRQWIVPEIEYQTAADWQDELTVAWHILLDSKNAKQRDKPSKDKEPVSRYSYYPTTVRYRNIPKGAHGASVVLPPSILERYGEPVVISVRITNKEGDILDGQDEGAANLKMPENWWENDGVFSAKDKSDTPLITRRQGLVDRSKSIFALVNPDDYEMVHQ